MRRWKEQSQGKGGAGNTEGREWLRVIEVRGQKIREWTECGNGEIHSCRTVRGAGGAHYCLSPRWRKLYMCVDVCRCVSLNHDLYFTQRETIM